MSVKALSEARVSAMKSGDTIAKSILSVLKSDADNLAKKTLRETTDADVEASAKSLVKKINESGKLKGSLSEKETAELEVLKAFVPKEASPEETKSKVDAMLAETGLDPKTTPVGQLMGKVKSLGVDMKIASEYLKELSK